MNFLRLGLLVTFSLIIYSCGKTDGFAPTTVLTNSVTISPSAITVAVNNNLTFTATGGSGSNSYSIFSGGGTILSTTGNYTAPTSPGTAVVRVIDGQGHYADSIITINATLQISPVNPSLSLSATQSFSSTGGVAPVTFSIVSGLGTISAAGFYSASGTPGAAVIRATDSYGNTSDTTVNVFGALGISPATVTVSINSSSNFTAAGGTGPYVFSLQSGGGSINSTTGAFIAPAVAGTSVVRVTDAMSATADATVTVVNAPPVISVIANQTVNEDIVLPISFTITDSDSTLNCSSSMSKSSSNLALLPLANIVFSGTAPNCTATLTPVANLSGSSNIVLTVSDSVNSVTSSFTYTVTAINDAPVISSITSKVVSEDSSVAVNFTVSDIDSVLTCSGSMTASTSNSALISTSNIVFSGTAPNCTATITPTADQNGSVNLTFRVSDSEPLFMDQTFAVTVNPINDAPIISSIAVQNVKSDSSLVVNYTISDIDSTLNCSSSVTVTSGTIAVLPTADITKGGTAPNCTLTIAPSLNVAGTSNISVTVTDGILSANRQFVLTVINVTSIAVSPSALSLAVSGVSQITASANYSDASASSITTNAGTSWSSSSPAKATVNNTVAKGQVTGVANGTTNVSATYKGLSSGNSAITVITATSVSVSTGSVTGGVGSQTFVSATAQDGVSSFDVTATGVWTTSNAAVATVSNGVISYVAAGSAVVTITYAGLSATVNVTVLNKSLVSIAVTASGGASSVQVNGTKNLIATATYSDASTQIVTNSATWSSTNTLVLTVSNTLPYIGRVTGVAGGTSTVTATLGAFSGNLLMTVNAVSLTSITITPDDALVTSGASYGLHATGTYSDASSADVTEMVTWASSNTAAATISNTSGSNGVATTPVFAGYKTTNITATLSSITGTTPFGVNGATISSIAITPSVTVMPNETYQLRAYANLSDGGVIDLTEFAIWSSGTVANVSVSNSLGSKGLITGVANGTSTITALFNAVSGTRVVTVAGSSALTEIGIGLTGSYYNWTGGAPPASPFLVGNKKGQRIDAKVNFAWALGSAPMGVSDMFSVRWTGFYKATSATNYFCTYSDDGVRVWVNGVQIINNWTEHSPTWNCSGNVALVAGTKYAVIIEYYENGGGSEAHFTRSSVSAADAQNTSTRAVPQIDLYPQ